jgi:hypothetical protein
VITQSTAKGYIHKSSGWCDLTESIVSLCGLKNKTTTPHWCLVTCERCIAMEYEMKKEEIQPILAMAKQFHGNCKADRCEWSAIVCRLECEASRALLHVHKTSAGALSFYGRNAHVMSWSECAGDAPQHFVRWCRYPAEDIFIESGEFARKALDDIGAKE